MQRTTSINADGTMREMDAEKSSLSKNVRVGSVRILLKARFAIAEHGAGVSALNLTQIYSLNIWLRSLPKCGGYLEMTGRCG
jgi:hypothetical protein